MSIAVDIIRGGRESGGLLYKVPCQEGNQVSQAGHHEERGQCDPGYLLHVWYQDVQSREIEVNDGDRKV